MDNKQWKERMVKIREKQAEQKKSDAFNNQYLTDEWLDLRERIIQRDNFRCVACAEKAEKLVVHHLLYQRGRRIWEVPDYYLVTLCHRCHIKEHSKTLYASPRHFKK